MAALMLGGCSTEGRFAALDRSLARGDCRAAAALFQPDPDGQRAVDDLLHLLDAAMVHLQCRDFETAQTYFHEAEDLADRLWTESLSRNTLALISSDRVLAYAGEDFERVMIHLMSAIAYLQAEQTESALVEVRRLDTLLAMYYAKYTPKPVYKEDAFARYLSGALYEANGDWDAAFIDYRRAAKTYLQDYRAYGTDLPDIVAADLVRTASIVGSPADVDGLVPEAIRDRERRPPHPPHAGKVVFITFAGYAPRKVQEMVVVPTPYGPVGMAFPKMVVTLPRCRQGRFLLEGGGRVFGDDLELVQDINRIAVKNLEDRKARVLTKAIARAAAKQAAIHGAAGADSDRDNQRTIARMLNTANTLFLERADTRSWRTLPGRIYMTRLYVPAGRYHAVLEICDGKTVDLGTLTVASGGMRFLFRDLRYPVSGEGGSAPDTFPQSVRGDPAAME